MRQWIKSGGVALLVLVVCLLSYDKLRSSQVAEEVMIAAQNYYKSSSVLSPRRLAITPNNGLVIGASGSTTGLTNGWADIYVSDQSVMVNINTATTTLLIGGLTAKTIRIGAINLITAGANNVALVSGTGATCGTGQTGIVGVSAATGWNWTANQGIAQGTGLGMIMKGVLGDSICMITSANVQISGSISFSIQ